jgi:choline-glycine betaine transporter
MKMKNRIKVFLLQLFSQILKDKDGNYSLREIIALVYVLMTIISWIAQQFFGRHVPEFMFYSFISMIGASAFGYSLERKSEEK